MCSRLVDSTAKNSTTATFFIDTNVLLYAASNATEDQAKRQIARGLLTQPDIGFSAQVLQEFYAAAISKKHLQMTHDEAVFVINSLTAFPVLHVCRDLVLQAIDTKHRFGKRAEGHPATLCNASIVACGFFIWFHL